MTSTLRVKLACFSKARGNCVHVFGCSCLWNENLSLTITLICVFIGHSTVFDKRFSGVFLLSLCNSEKQMCTSRNMYL